MTALWCDSFAGYTNLTQKYDSAASVSIDSGAGRYGTAGAVFSSGSLASIGSLVKSVGSAATLVVGFAWYGTAPTTNTGLSYDYLLEFNFGTDSQLALDITSSGVLLVNNGTLLGSSTLALSMYHWYYIEFKTYFNTSGTYEVRVDGAVWISGTGNTDPNGHGAANQVRWGSAAQPVIDDLYVCNSAGAYNNDYLGDCRVLSLLPQADGTFTQWTPSSGPTHYVLVDEVPPSTLEYVGATSGSPSDTYFTTTQDAFLRDASFVQQCLYTSATANKNVTPAYYSSGSLYFNPAVTMTTSPAYSYSVWERRPNTGTPFTGNALNQNEFGVTL